MTFLEESQILDEQITTVEALEELLARETPDTEPYSAELLPTDDGVLRIKAVERKTNLARTHRLRRTLFEANEYRQLARVHAELVKMAGTPPFSGRARVRGAPRRCRSRTCAASSWRSRRRASRCSASRASAR